MESTLAELRQQPHTSISAIKSFLQCPRKYRLQYIDRVRPAFRSAALVLGSAWHDTIDEWLLADHAEPEALRAHLRDGLVRRLQADDVLFDEEDEDEGRLTDVALRMLGVFLVKVQKPERTLGVELPFSLELTHPMTGETLPTALIGALDAVVVSGGTELVWELKTAKRKWGVDQVEFDLQATMYKVGARTLGFGEAELEVLVTTKWRVPDVQVERLVRHRRDEVELADVILSVHRGIAAGVDHPVRGWMCRTCAFAGVCGT